jgi:hypothetical protein
VSDFLWVQELNAYTRGKRTSTGFLILNQCWTCIGQLKDFFAS